MNSIRKKMNAKIITFSFSCYTIKMRNKAKAPLPAAFAE